MKRHYIGHAYLFHPEPDQGLPLVEMQAFSQFEDTPESLLIQLNEEDLKPIFREDRAFLHARILI
jgi:hypothetical protein